MIYMLETYSQEGEYSEDEKTDESVDMWGIGNYADVSLNNGFG